MNSFRNLFTGRNLAIIAVILFSPLMISAEPTDVPNPEVAAKDAKDQAKEKADASADLLMRNLCKKIVVDFKSRCGSFAPNCDSEKDYNKIRDGLVECLSKKVPNPIIFDVAGKCVEEQLAWEKYLKELGDKKLLENIFKRCNVLTDQDKQIFNKNINDILGLVVPEWIDCASITDAQFADIKKQIDKYKKDIDIISKIGEVDGRPCSDFMNGIGGKVIVDSKCESVKAEGISLKKEIDTYIENDINKKMWTACVPDDANRTPTNGDIWAANVTGFVPTRPAPLDCTKASKEGLEKYISSMATIKQNFDKLKKATCADLTKGFVFAKPKPVYSEIVTSGGRCSVVVNLTSISENKSDTSAVQSYLKSTVKGAVIDIYPNSSLMGGSDLRPTDRALIRNINSVSVAKISGTFGSTICYLNKPGVTTGTLFASTISCSGDPACDSSGSSGLETSSVGCPVSGVASDGQPFNGPAYEYVNGVCYRKDSFPYYTGGKGGVGCDSVRESKMGSTCVCKDTFKGVPVYLFGDYCYTKTEICSLRSTKTKSSVSAFGPCKGGICKGTTASLDCSGK
jgi:hypothetical protein